jgi:hypothetical protein
MNEIDRSLMDSEAGFGMFILLLIIIVIVVAIRVWRNK